MLIILVKRSSAVWVSLTHNSLEKCNGDPSRTNSPTPALGPTGPRVGLACQQPGSGPTLPRNLGLYSLNWKTGMTWPFSQQYHYWMHGGRIAFQLGLALKWHNFNTLVTDHKVFRLKLISNGNDFQLNLHVIKITTIWKIHVYHDVTWLLVKWEGQIM